VNEENHRAQMRLLETRALMFEAASELLHFTKWALLGATIKYLFF
jgi:hypothetical protein